MSGFIRPNEILDQIPIEQNVLAAEFGCGTGKFALELARRAPKGKVYGMDIQQEPLLVLEKEARLKGTYNIQTVRCDLEKKGGSTLPDGYLDLVLIPNVLFQAEERIKIIEEAARVLRPGGKLLILDWKRESGFGPESKMRVSPEEAREKTEEKGFKFEKELESGSFHWAFLFEKK